MLSSALVYFVLPFLFIRHSAQKAINRRKGTDKLTALAYLWLQNSLQRLPTMTSVVALQISALGR